MNKHTILLKITHSRTFFIGTSGIYNHNNNRNYYFRYFSFSHILQVNEDTNNLNQDINKDIQNLYNRLSFNKQLFNDSLDRYYSTFEREKDNILTHELPFVNQLLYRLTTKETKISLEYFRFGTTHITHNISSYDPTPTQNNVYSNIRIMHQQVEHELTSFQGISNILLKDQNIPTERKIDLVIYNNKLNDFLKSLKNHFDFMEETLTEQAKITNELASLEGHSTVPETWQIDPIYPSISIRNDSLIYNMYSPGHGLFEHNQDLLEFPNLSFTRGLFTHPAQGPSLEGRGFSTVNISDLQNAAILHEKNYTNTSRVELLKDIKKHLDILSYFRNEKKELNTYFQPGITRELHGLPKDNKSLDLLWSEEQKDKFWNSKPSIIKEIGVNTQKGIIVHESPMSMLRNTTIKKDSLIDDFADLSTEMTDICGGDD